MLKWEPDAGASQSIFPAIFAGLFGAGVVNLAFADAAEVFVYVVYAVVVEV